MPLIIVTGAFLFIPSQEPNLKKINANIMLVIIHIHLGFGIRIASSVLLEGVRLRFYLGLNGSHCTDPCIPSLPAPVYDYLNTLRRTQKQQVIYSSIDVRYLCIIEFQIGVIYLAFQKSCGCYFFFTV